MPKHIDEDPLERIERRHAHVHSSVTYDAAWRRAGRSLAEALPGFRRQRPRRADQLAEIQNGADEIALLMAEDLAWLGAVARPPCRRKRRG
jgi:hypothetical protein